MLCQQLLMHILCELRKGGEKKPTETRSNQKTVSKMILVKNYLVDHYHEKINMKDIEEISGLSKRIEKAKELAMQTDLSFGEIAEKVGYSDIHTSSRIFKRKTGSSLSQFALP
ncbi:helix-turn-helix domain-containing protein [Paenibacillus sp. MSJ-34]|uniref:helix-turn-helix domain-containing protein n=2 Tax=unclassified Paenibacillus TaxID=185978 RepID=UPI001C106638|nr:helix-turn-helix domain-containing protein [Paenibacillus sp. MSJ-34]MBU5441357.1 helix-turn-helix domain-containing protein [Paenibacillus sp. MSJ-34]CAH0120924.1 hypothetical protein PAE9249_03449 [Paenibacillus sp. CECT 9249]